MAWSEMAETTTNQLDVALMHAERLLTRDLALAIEQADAILEAVPGHPRAELIRARAQQGLGKAEGATAIQRLAREQPRWAEAQFELGRLRASAGEFEAAIAAYRDALDLRDTYPAAWGALGDALHASGAFIDADDAYANQIRTSTHDPRLMSAAQALCANKLAPAEALLREHLKQSPTDVAAIRMLAEVGARLGRYGDAELLLTRALELAPSFAPARHNLALVLLRQSKMLPALREIETLRRADPADTQYRNLQAAALSRLGDYEGALALYGDVLAELPGEPRLWMSYGHALKTANRTDEAIAAYREAAKLNPDFGDAYWSLANLKTFRFSGAEIEAMGAALKRDLREDDRFHMHYRAWQGARGRRRLRAIFRTLRRGRAPSACVRGLRWRIHQRSSPPHQGALHQRFPCRASGRRRRCARSNFHRRTATLRLDADRADSRHALDDRRHH